MQMCDVDCYGKCERTIYVNSKCILHCKKNDYQEDRHSGLLKEFYTEFIKYTIGELFKHTEFLEDELSEENLFTYFMSNDFNNEQYNNILNETIFIPSCIHFPKRDSRDFFDYQKILNLFGQIHFNFCEFYLSSLDLKNIKCFFQDCMFHDSWTLYNYCLLENDDDVIYQTCTFQKDISNYTPDKDKKLAIYDYSQFDYTCQFNSSIKFNRVKFSMPLFKTNQYNYLNDRTIGLLEFIQCTFEKKFELNKLKITLFTCFDSLFNGKFEFKENEIDLFTVYNTNFESISDLYGCKFKRFNIEKSIFNNFAGFEKCIFGTENKLDEEVAVFKHTTFKDNFNIRDSKFLSGIDLRNTNLQGETNLLNAEINTNNTNRESFRVLKHSFDSIGNIIEANKYYQKEMKKREEELRRDLPSNLFEWCIFKIHGLSSNHSQNSLLALFWIYIISLFFALFVFYEKEDEYLNKFNCTFRNSWLNYTYNNDGLFDFAIIIIIPIILGIIFTLINNYGKIGLWILFCLFWTGSYILITHDYSLSIVANSVNPFSIITEKGTLTLGELLYKIIIAYLIYQLIISIRQDTRRK